MNNSLDNLIYEFFHTFNDAYDYVCRNYDKNAEWFIDDLKMYDRLYGDDDFRDFVYYFEEVCTNYALNNDVEKVSFIKACESMNILEEFI